VSTESGTARVVCIRDDPTIRRLLERMPESVASSFSDEQLMHLRNAVGARNWGNHSIDARGVVTFPMLGWRYYYVILLGKNRRQLSPREANFALSIGSLFFILLLLLIFTFTLLVLYLLKSAAGIDLFSGFSLGIWTWFKANIF
jgi:hypothetical protein